MVQIATEQAGKRLASAIGNGAVGKGLFADFNHAETKGIMPANAKEPFGLFI